MRAHSINAMLVVSAMLVACSSTPSLDNDWAQLDYRRVRKIFISPSTRDIALATYYGRVAEKIEEVGTSNFPVNDGKSVYGVTYLSIPIDQDGGIFERDGGPSVERSSGNDFLDSYALRIARMAAPYPSFKPTASEENVKEVRVLTYRFSFQRVE